MKIKLLTGKEVDDPLFDLPEDQQRAYIARCMDCNPNYPEGWPNSIIVRLLNVRRHKGREEFYRALGQTMSPDCH